MKLVCVKCEGEMRPRNNDAAVVEMANFGPYKLWNADIWACPGCGFEVVAGFAQKPFAEYFEQGFLGALEHTKQTRRLVHDYEWNAKERGKPNQEEE